MLVLAAGCQGLADMTPENQKTPSTEPTEGFALYANLPVTRTILDKENFTLSWNKNDQMAVFNAPAGTEEYSSNLRFYVDEETTGKFTPGEGVEVPFEEGVNYD